MSARTQTMSNAPALTVTPAEPSSKTRAPRKLRRPEQPDRGGNVLPPRSGSGYGQTNAAGEVVYGEKVNGPAVPRIQAAVENAKQRRRERQAGRSGSKRAEVSRRNMIVDADGVAHDSEYVQFRTATPIHVQSKETANGYPDDDGSASSSASSASSAGDPVGAYRYPTSARPGSLAAGSHHHHHRLHPTSQAGRSSTKHMTMTTASAIPPLRDGYVRSSASSSLLVPRAPSPKRRSFENDHPGGYSIAAISRLRTGAPSPQFTTSSYQPPAPPISSTTPRQTGAGGVGSSLREPSIMGGVAGAMGGGGGSDVASLTSSMARTSLAEPYGSRSGYDRYARDNSPRPPKLEGSAMDAGMHGMKRSFDGFKLDMKFGAYKALRKLERKIV